MLKNTIRLKERNDPEVLIWISDRETDGTLSPHDFTGADDIEFWQKLSSDATDPGTATYKMSNASIVLQAAPPLDQDGKSMAGRMERNVLTVKMSANNLEPPGTQFYRVDEIRSSKRTTVISGPLIIENI